MIHKVLNASLYSAVIPRSNKPQLKSVKTSVISLVKINLTCFSKIIIFFVLEGSKEAGILTSFIAAGILYHLLQACVKGNSLLCTRQLIFSCPDKSASAKHHNCNKINWQIPERIIGMFFKKIPDSYRYDIFEHNLQVGFDVSSYVTIFGLLLAHGRGNISRLTNRFKNTQHFYCYDFLLVYILTTFCIHSTTAAGAFQSLICIQQIQRWWFKHLVSSLWVCLSAEGTKNISWLPVPGHLRSEDGVV